jgi:cytochrome P450
MATGVLASFQHRSERTGAERTTSVSSSKVPGPLNYPYVGQALPFWLDPLGYTVSLQRKYGDMVRYHVRGRPIYLLGHPDHVRYVFDRNPSNYRKSDFYDAVRPFFGNGLGLSEGEFWKRQRQTMQPAFHRERIVAMTEVMIAGAADLADSWATVADSGDSVEVVNPLMCVALNIATRSLFGVDSQEVFDRMTWALPTVLKGAEKRVWSLLPISYKLPTPLNLRFNKAIRELDEIVGGVIEDRRRTGRKADPGDLLDMLLEARDEDGNGLTNQQLRDEVLTIFIAGFETVASAMSFALDLLAHHPEVQEKVQAELDEKLGGRPIGVADVRELTYLNMMFQEVMRLYPPVWTVSRAPLTDDEIGGHRVPAGATIQIAPYLMHRDPRWWDKPDQFWPEHFTKERQDARPRYAYMPFGGGPRVCLGRNFAMMEGPIVLGTLLQRYRVTPGSARPTTPQAMISLRPHRGAWVRLTPRR